MAKKEIGKYMDPMIMYIYYQIHTIYLPTIIIYHI